MRWLAAAVLFLGLSAAARADGTSAADSGAIQDVINQQLAAIGKGDAAGAESFASPTIQEKFGSPDAFMGMVQSRYAQLVKPKSTRFESLDQTSLGLVQKMTVIDSAGVPWTVAYTMVQVDGHWRINGCFILKSDAVSA